MPERMYQFAEDQEGDAAHEALLDAGLALLAAGGSRAASVRAVAERAGLSPTLVSYRFGSRAGFLDALMQREVRRDHAAWQARRAQLSGMTLAPGSLAGLLHAVLREDFVAARERAALRWLSHLDAARRGEGASAGPAWADGPTAFWAEALARCGLDPAFADGVTAFSLSFGQGYLVCGSGLGFEAWARDACDRFADRLIGRAPVRAGDSPWRLAAEALPTPAAGPEATGARAIIEAAVDIILTDGAGALTHRAIAAHAGISLSATTHHFRNRRDILACAFEEIYRRAVRQTRAVEGLAARVSGAELLARLEGVIGPDDPARLPEGAGLQEVMCEAARHPETAALARSMFARTGTHSFIMLAALTGGRTDRLDAHVFRHMLTGLATLGTALGTALGAAPAQERRVAQLRLWIARFESV